MNIYITKNQKEMKSKKEKDFHKCEMGVLYLIFVERRRGLQLKGENFFFPTSLSLSFSFLVKHSSPLLN